MTRRSGILEGEGETRSFLKPAGRPFPTRLLFPGQFAVSSSCFRKLGGVKLSSLLSSGLVAARRWYGRDLLGDAPV